LAGAADDADADEDSESADEVLLSLDALLDALLDAVLDSLPDAVLDSLPDALLDSLPDAVLDSLPDAVLDSLLDVLVALVGALLGLELVALVLPVLAALQAVRRTAKAAVPARTIRCRADSGFELLDTGLSFLRLDKWGGDWFGLTDR